MFDIPDVEHETLRLLEPTDAGRVLGVSASRVRALADEGRLKVAAKTERGLRLFTPDDVERLKAEREAGRQAREAGQGSRALLGPAGDRMLQRPAQSR
jgi:hypothetical protein